MLNYFENKKYENMSCIKDKNDNGFEVNNEKI